MSQTQILQRYLPIINVNGIPHVLIPTTADIIYSDEHTLNEALAAHKEQILASAAAVAQQAAKVADVESWLAEHLGYAPAQHETGGSYLTPLMTELEKVPTVTPQAQAVGEETVGEEAV